MNRLAQRFHLRRLRRVVGAAFCVQDSARFALAELRDEPSVRRHRLRHGGLLAEVRHPLLDLWVIEEVFRFGVYEPPVAVRQALAAVSGPLRILDLGGHIGLFGLFMLTAHPDARITSFEPDPRNVEILRRCIEINDLSARWSVVEAAAATSNGTAELASAFHLSRMASPTDGALGQLQGQLADVFPFLAGTGLLESRRELVQRRDALPWFADTDLIKIDIEGGEWDLLADPRLRESRAKAIVLEYHPGYLADADAEAVLTRLLARGGYVVDVPRRRGDAGIVWAWRPAAESS